MINKRGKEKKKIHLKKNTLIFYFIKKRFEALVAFNKFNTT